MVISKATVSKFFQKARSMSQAFAHFRTRRFQGQDMLVTDQRRDDRLIDTILKLERAGIITKNSGLILTVKGENAYNHPSAVEEACSA